MSPQQNIIILGRDNQGVASGPFLSEILCPLLRAFHHCVVKKVVYHSRAIFKEALKQVMFFKIKQIIWENVSKEAAFKCPAAKLYKLFVLYVYYALELS